MGRVIYDTATTFNGWIADRLNSLDWLFAVDQDGLPPDGADVRFVSGAVSDVLSMIIDAADGGDVWVIGGGDLAGQFLDAGALDEIRLSVAPVALDGGAPLLPRNLGADRLRLVSASAFGQFARLVYSVR